MHHIRPGSVSGLGPPCQDWELFDGCYGCPVQPIHGEMTCGVFAAAGGPEMGGRSGPARSGIPDLSHS